jgi:hypothetical protein
LRKDLQARNPLQVDALIMRGLSALELLPAYV